MCHLYDVEAPSKTKYLMWLIGDMGVTGIIFQYPNSARDESIPNPHDSFISETLELDSWNQINSWRHSPEQQSTVVLSQLSSSVLLSFIQKVLVFLRTRRQNHKL